MVDAAVARDNRNPPAGYMAYYMEKIEAQCDSNHYTKTEKCDREFIDADKKNLIPNIPYGITNVVDIS